VGAGTACTCEAWPGTRNWIARILPEQGDASRPRCQSVNIRKQAYQLLRKLNSASWEIRRGCYKFGVRKCEYQGTGSMMNFASFCRRVIVGDQAVARGSSAQRRGGAWLFIALVALFLTQPDDEPRSRFDRPLPLPAELNVEEASLRSLAEPTPGIGVDPRVRGDDAPGNQGVSVVSTTAVVN
jgi:hypothetical protein